MKLFCKKTASSFSFLKWLEPAVLWFIYLFIKTETAVLWFWLKEPKPEIINKIKYPTNTTGYYNTALPPTIVV
jgi:hypothetical protein